MTDAAVSLDGRHVRRRQNVVAVVDALYELWSEGHLQPNAREIAERSGVSLRSVFRYFDDMNTLVSTAIERRMSDTDHHFAPLPSHGTLRDRCLRLAAHRVRYQADVEAITAAVRLHAPFHPALAAVISHRVDQLRDQLAGLFAVELAPLDSPERCDRLAALEAATGYDAVALLRRSRRLPPDRAERVLADAALRLLS